MPYNVERMLYLATDGDAAKVAGCMSLELPPRFFVFVRLPWGDRFRYGNNSWPLSKSISVRRAKGVMYPPSSSLHSLSHFSYVAGMKQFYAEGKTVIPQEVLAVLRDKYGVYSQLWI